MCIPISVLGPVLKCNHFIQGKYHKIRHHFLLNDFGITETEDLEYIDAKIKEIDDNFHLILVQER